MSADFLEPYDKLIRITILGRPAEVPENNTLLRCFQFLAPETIPCGRFCWNNECGNSKFYYKRPDDPRERKSRACCFRKVKEGLEITVLSAELKFALRSFLNSTPIEVHDGGAEEPDPFELPEIRFKD